MSEERPAYSSMVAGLAAAIRDDDPAPVGIGPETRADPAEPGTAYGALPAALAHERACWADYQAQQTRSAWPWEYAAAEQRWRDATALVAGLRARVAGEKEARGDDRDGE